MASYVTVENDRVRLIQALPTYLLIGCCSEPGKAATAVGRDVRCARAVASDSRPIDECAVDRQIVIHPLTGADLSMRRMPCVEL